MFGDVWSVSNKPYFLTATTVTGCTLKYMDPASFVKVLQSDYNIIQEWISNQSEIIEFLMEQLTDISFLDKESMLCKYLYRLSFNYGVQANIGVKINSKITHQLLADLIGCSRVTVSKIMSNMLKRNIISKQNHTARQYRPYRTSVD
jgi:CRP-like cAMP-binding protein